MVAKLELSESRRWPTAAAVFLLYLAFLGLIIALLALMNKKSGGGKPGYVRLQWMAKYLIDRLSVFFPAYNEEENLEKTVLDAKKVLLEVARQWEIIIVDDGSKDRTGEIADKLAAENNKVVVVHHHLNRGYGAALKSGYQKARYPWVAFADSDGQFDFSEIKKFLAYTGSADLILGYRIKRADSFMRSVFTFIWGVIPRIILGLRIKDYSCGFKLIKKEVFISVQPLVGEEKVTQIEMLTKAQRKGFKIIEIGVHHFPREHGQQTGANLKVVLRSIGDLLTLYQDLRNR